MISRGLILSLLFLLASCAQPHRRPAIFPKGETVQLFYDVSDLPHGRAEARWHGFPIRAGQRLNADQRRRLESAIVIRPIDPNEAFAACFVPHHFFRYFDSAGNETGSVAVCFCCGGAKPSSQDPSMSSEETYQADLGEISAIVTELGVSTDLGCGDAG